MKFNKLFIDGYFIEYRGLHITVRKEHGSSRWLAEVKVQDGLKLIRECGLNGLDSHATTRKQAVANVIENIEHRADYSDSFRRFCANRQEFNYIEALNYEALLRECEEIRKQVRTQA